MQPLLQTLRDDYKVGLHEGLLSTTDLTRWFGNDGGILVLDDLVAEGGNDKQVSVHETFASSELHDDLPVSRHVNHQAHYIVAFKSPRDKLGLKNLLFSVF